ncbi:MAG: hypothetical protein IT245_03980 [Bacteroidia bacterium]|nr:hypothetical protein [Bacteroidia bacterium]
MLQIDKIEKEFLKGEVNLPRSKSILNRELIINAISGRIATDSFENEANDVKILYNALKSPLNSELNFFDAGTPLRLYLSYAAMMDIKGIRIFGDDRLIERPISDLLKSLEQLGAEFEFELKGYSLPLKIIKGIDKTKHEVRIDASRSSQFVSSLLLIAPYMKSEFVIEIVGESRSQPYIDMTIKQMEYHGIKVEKQANIFIVKPAKYNIDKTYEELDWSSAAFIYGMAAMAKDCDIFIPKLRVDSVQGDAYCYKIFEQLGVETKEEEFGVRLLKSKSTIDKLEIDFKNIPDLFPVVLSVTICLGISGDFTGIKNLREKESNRVKAMIDNLIPIGVKFKEEEDRLLTDPNINGGKEIIFDSYNDHRIAMALSIFAFKQSINIRGFKTVEKSFPGYWAKFSELSAVVTEEIFK